MTSINLSSPKPGIKENSKSNKSLKKKLSFDRTGASNAFKFFCRLHDVERGASVY